MISNLECCFNKENTNTLLPALDMTVRLREGVPPTVSFPDDLHHPQFAIKNPIAF